MYYRRSGKWCARSVGTGSLRLFFQRCPPPGAVVVRGGPRCPAIGFPRASVGGGGCCGRRPGESRASRSCVVSCGAGGGLVGCGPSLGDAQRACGVGRGLPVA